MNVSLTAIALLCLLGMPACSLTASPPSPHTGQATPSGAPTGAVTVSGNKLLRGGAPFIIHGVQIVGLVAPEAALRAQYATAHQHFGPAELAAAKQWGANTIRFQVSQAGLDPQSSLYSAGYVADVRDAVRQATSDGFAVIVSMQDQPPSGDPVFHGMPTDGTARAWQTVAPIFADMRNVLYELFNEPVLPPTPNNWRIWQAGGASPAFGNSVAVQAMGMQTLVSQIRGAGAQNVILADGLGFAKFLNGVPLLSDPTGQLAYAVHPYFGSESWLRPTPEQAWAREWGNLSAQVPVIATEWDASSGKSSCQPNYPQLTPAFLTYLVQHQVGIVGFAFDIPGTIVTDFNYTPTTYDNFVCGQTGSGPGKLLQQHFQAI